MPATSESRAYSGGPPTSYPRTSLFDFVFGNPFHSEGPHVPPTKRLPLIDPAQPIFIDNKTSESCTSHLCILILSRETNATLQIDHLLSDAPKKMHSRLLQT